MSKKAYYIDACGEKVAARHVKKYDRDRDKIANQIFRDWEAEEARLKKLKGVTLERVERLQQAAAAEAGVKDLGGKAGNIQFRSFDGRITVAVDNAKRTEFDERLHLAEQLIMEAVTEISEKVMADSNASPEQRAMVKDLVEIATRAFKPRKSGKLDMQRVRELRTYNVKHPKWKKACEIISECERVIGHRRYIRVTVRQTPDSTPRPIVLDVAAL